MCVGGNRAKNSSFVTVSFPAPWRWRLRGDFVTAILLFDGDKSGWARMARRAGRGAAEAATAAGLNPSV